MLRLLLLLWITAFLSHASGTLKLESDGAYSPQGHISYLEDRAGNLEFPEVQEHRFSPYAGNTVNFGFTRSVYWFRIDLERDIQAAQKRWWLMITYPLLEHVDVYLVDADKRLISRQKLGSMVPGTIRELPLREFVTELSLREFTHTTLYLRVQTQSSMQLPMTIHSSESLFEEAERSNLEIGIYYGIFLIILLYNAGIYFYTKDPNYLRYIFFLSAYILWQLSFDGIGREYFWSGCYWIIEHGSSFWIAMSAYTALYFSRNFLHTSQYAPKMDRIIGWMMAISIILAVASLLLPYGKVIQFNAALASVLPAILLVTGILVMRKYRPARFYIAGWSSFLIGTLIFAFNKFDLIPNFYGVNHIQQIGSAIEMMFLSWALADRVHLLQKEYVDKLSHLNETLTLKVNDALTEIRQKDQLFVQQSRLAALGEMIEQIAHQWRQPLNTLALINQDLYVKYKLGQCNEACFERSHDQIDHHLQYMSKTIDDFRNFYKTDKSKHLENPEDLVKNALLLSEVFLKYAKIKTEVRSTATLKVNIAKNEMIQVLMNLIKNAHDAIMEQGNRNGKILITVEDDDGQIRITVDDNAGGIRPDVMERVFDIYFTTKDPEHGTGIGLHMSKYIIENSFGGQIWVENIPGGARFVILLPASAPETLVSESD